jgi:hypothetical protein
MPVLKKQNTTVPSSGATPNIVSSEQAKLENFHQYLRAEIRYAPRVVIEEVIREELSHFLGAHPHEHQEANVHLRHHHLQEAIARILW